MRFMKISSHKLYLVAIALNVLLMNVHASDFWLNNSVSPQVENMIRYGDVETSLFTGTLNFSIPIYSLKDPDFNLDLALHYNSDGFKPLKHSGYVGYNWYLQAGGCITREVRGYADEVKRYWKQTRDENDVIHKYYKEGMYHFIQKNSINPDAVFRQDPSTFTDTAMFLNDRYMHYFQNVGKTGNTQVDYMPDIFHFDFLGYRGSFMINNSGKVQIISGDFVDVDISKIMDDGSLWYRSGLLRSSQITIQTKDGYTYVFGGRFAALEFTYPTELYYTDGNEVYMDEIVVSESVTSSDYPNISAWHLSQVIAPNGKTMTYYYLEDDNPNSSDNSPSYSYYYYFDGTMYTRLNEARARYFYNNLYYDIFADAFQSCVISGVWKDWLNGYSMHQYELCGLESGINSLGSCITKGCFLKSIEISGETPLQVRFDTILNARLLNTPKYLGYGGNNPMLKSIQVSSNDTLLCEADLSYETKSTGTNNWHFLSKVDILGKGEYKLQYNHVKAYPKVGHYGFFDKQYASTIDIFTGYWFYDDSFQGMLKEVSFPTGGRQVYEYEHHDYGTHRIFVNKLDHLELCSKDILTPWAIGGARIKRVCTYDHEDNKVEEREYTYQVGESGNPSGVLYTTYAVYNQSEDSLFLYPTNLNYNLYDSQIGYSDVIERIKDGNDVELYKKVYSFDTGLAKYSTKNNSIHIGKNKVLFNDKGKVVSNEGSPDCTAYCGILTYPEILHAKGKMLAYNCHHNNEIVKSVEYTYNGGSQADAKQFGCMDSVIVYYHYIAPYLICSPVSRKLYIYPDVLTKEVIKEDGLTTTKTYSYDKKLRVTKETITDSRGIEHFTKYTYPDEIKLTTNAWSFNDPPLRRLTKANRINTPVEKVSGYIRNGSEYVTSGQINLYANEMYVKVYDKNQNNGSAHAPSINSGTNLGWQMDTIGFHLDNSGIIGNDDALGELDYYPYLYQTKSLAITNPIVDYKKMSANGETITYDDRYKLDAEYKFNQEGRLLSIKPFGQMETTYTWNGIYPTSKTIGNQTWKYSFIPYVGVKEIVDPRGVITRYEYDNAGRLIKESQVIDGKEQVLNVYQYHIKSEK